MLLNSEDVLASIQGKCLEDGDRCIVVGDLNARCGVNIDRIIQYDPKYKYVDIPDPLPNPNANGGKLIQFCIDCDFLILNNLSTYFSHWKSALTFRRKSMWISSWTCV